jgi:energy-coupling factor transport system ATP-binding protein
MIKLNHITFQYESGIQNNGLSDLSLFVKSGEVVLLCGESGCGKTTLTRIINGLIPHFYNGKLSGEVIVNEKNITEIPLHEIAKHVGSVFQNPRSQFYCMDTTSEIAFGCENQGIPIDNINKRIELTASQLSIQDLMNRNIFNLSGGEKQKIACGSVNAAFPEVIVLDEPSSNLDPDSTENLGKIISHWKNDGKTILIAEHRIHYLKDIADRIVFMRDGKIEKIFSISDFKKLKEYEIKSMGLRPLSLDALYPEYVSNEHSSEKIELFDFHFSYKNGLNALSIDQIDFPKGHIIGVFGKNGAGKSTFARCLCGLNKKFKGKIKIGNKVYKNKQFLENAYMVMQDVNHQLFTETVLDEVLLSMEVKDEIKAKSILESLNLLHMEDLHPMSLSGGQKQRVAIASAVASEREIIIFDEPTSGLDLKHMIQVSKNLKYLKDIGKTIIIITHDLEFILKTCDYFVHLKNGKVCKENFLDDFSINYLSSFFSCNNKNDIVSIN